MIERRCAAFSKFIDTDEEYSIKPFLLNLDEIFLNSFLSSQDKLAFSLRLILEDELKLIKFGINQLRNFSLALINNPNIKHEITETNIKDIFNLMVKVADSQIIFEAAWVFINLTQISKLYTNMIAKCEDIITGLFDMLESKKDLKIKNQILWIFANLIGDGEEIFLLITNSVDIINYVCNQISVHSDLPNYFKINLFWITGNFLKYKTFPKEDNFKSIFSIFPIIIKYIKSQDEFLFSETLICIFKLVHHLNDEVFEFLKNSEITKTIVPLISVNTHHCDLGNIIAIIMNLSWKDDTNIEEMVNLNIYDYMEQFLFDYLNLLKSGENTNLRKNVKLLKEFLICISNFSSCDKKYIQEALIKNKKIKKYLIELLEYFPNKEIVYEVLLIFYNLLGSDDIKIKAEILRIQVPELFLEYLARDYDPKIKSLCLNGINEFLEYGDQIIPEKNIVLEHLTLLGLPCELYKLSTDANEELAEISNQIYNLYYNY